jgi:O-antigen ligase
MNFKDKTLKYLVFALVFLAPLVYWSHGLYPHISSKTFFICGIIEALFFAWIYAVSVDKSYRLSKQNLLWFLPLVGFTVWMTIAGIFAVNPGLSFWSSLGRGTGLLTLYHSLALAFVIASLVRKHGLSFIYSLFQWFIAGSFVLAVSVWMGTDGFRTSFNALLTDNGGGFTGNSTITATYFLFTLAFSSFLLAVKSVSKTKKWLIGIVMATIIFSPVFISVYGYFVDRGMLGTARGTLLSLGVGIFTSALGYLFLSQKKALRGVSIGIFAIAIISFGFLWAQLMNPTTSLHQKFSTEARGSRFIFWNIADIGIHKHPLLGYGPENYFMAFQENFDPEILVVENSFEGWTDRAHNQYYDLGVQSGYPAVILYVIFLMGIFYGLYKAQKRGNLSRVQVSILAGLVVSYIANNLFTFDSNLSYMSLFMIAGLVYTLVNKDDNTKKISTVKIDQSSKNFLASGLFVAFIVSFIFFVQMPAHKSKLYAETFATAINKRHDLYQNLIPGSSIGEQWDVSGLAYDVHKVYSSNPSAVKNDPKLLPYAIKDVQALISYLEKVSENNTTDYRLYITRAMLENTLTYLSDRPFDKEHAENILSILDHARDLSPTNPNVYWVLAQTRIWGGDLVGAEEAYREAIAVAPHLSTSYSLLLRYAEILGNKKLFDEIMIKAKENISGFKYK